MDKILSIAVASIFVAASAFAAPAVAASSQDAEDGVAMKATWYGPGYIGKPTANGEKFDGKRLTAAHPTLPLGSRVLVRLKNGRGVVVSITDRPAVDVIDLSRSAARVLHLLGKGHDMVRIQVLSMSDDG